MISGIYAKFAIRMMLSPISTIDVRMDFSLPEWSLDYYCISYNRSSTAFFVCFEK